MAEELIIINQKAISCKNRKEQGEPIMIIEI